MTDEKIQPTILEGRKLEKRKKKALISTANHAVMEKPKHVVDEVEMERKELLILRIIPWIEECSREFNTWEGP